MKLYKFLTEGRDPKPEQKIVDKFARTSDSQRSYYIMKWAEEKGIDGDDAMFMAGYVKDGYMGAGAWNWRYVGMGKRVQEAESNMIGEPDRFYDAEQRKEAYNDLQDALAQSNSTEAEYVKDGSCPECPNVEDDEDCNGFGNYGCDDGELTYMNDTVSWKEIKDHDERQAEKANRGPAPDKETVMKVLPRLHDDYVKSGRYNAFELPSILRQMYPELGKREAAGYTAEFFKTFEESLDENYDPKLITMLSQFEQDCEEKGYYGDTDVITIDQLIKAGKTEEAAEEMASTMTDQDGGSSKFDHIYDMAKDAIDDYTVEPAMAEMKKLAGL